MIRKIGEQRKKTRKESIKATLRSLLFQYLFRQMSYQTRMYQNDPYLNECLEEILYEYRVTLRDTSIQIKIRQLAEKKLLTYYKQNLNDRRWSIRMNTLYRIADFCMVSLEHDMWLYLERESISREEKYQTYIILAIFQTKELIPHIIQSNIYLPHSIWVDMCRHMGDCFQQSIDLFDSLPMPLNKGVIQVIGEKRDTKYVQFLEEHLTLTDPELRIAIIKALISVGYISSLSLIKESQQADTWEERLMVIKLFATLRKPICIPYLLQSISDPNWWVRFNAAKALSDYPNGTDLLYKVLDSNNDRYAREMAQDWLDRRMNIEHK